jgi:hypothetical protein
MKGFNEGEEILEINKQISEVETEFSKKVVDG